MRSVMVPFDGRSGRGRGQRDETCRSAGCLTAEDGQACTWTAASRRFLLCQRTH